MMSRLEMERSRESRKMTMAAPSGLTRRRHRGSGLRDSPDEDGPVELQETAREKDRKKERERERERDRERSNRSKRRKGDRLMHSGNREDGPEESTDESVNDDEEEDYEEDGRGGGSSRMPPPNPASTSSPSASVHHQNQQRRNFFQSIPSTRTFKPASPLKPADEMIGVPVPRKARSASTKRAHECWMSGSGGNIGGDKLHRQASTSPARSSLVSATASPSRISPSSSNISIRKKTKLIGTNNHRTPPKSSSTRAVSSNQDEIEFEIAEVLYGMMRQPPGLAAKQEDRFDEALNKSTSDSKSRVSSPVSTAAPQQPSTLLSRNPGASAMVATARKRRRARPANYSDEHFAFPSKPNLISKLDVEKVAIGATMSPNPEKILIPVLGNREVSSDLEHSQNVDLTKPVGNTWPESLNLRPEPIVAGLKDEDANSTKRDSPGNRFDETRDDNFMSTTSGLEIKWEEKLQIDLMGRELKSMVKDASKTKLSSNDSRHYGEPVQKRFRRGLVEESEGQKGSFKKEKFVELTDGEDSMATAGANRQQLCKHRQQAQSHLQRAPTGDEATGDITAILAASSLPQDMPMAGWHGGISPLGYMTSPQGVVSLAGSAISPAQVQPQLLLNQPRPKRCATHCYIARNISYHQQFTRMNPYWSAAVGSAATLYGAKPCNLNGVPTVDLHGSTGIRGVNLVQDKNLGVYPGSNTGNSKGSQAPNIADTAQRKQILHQQSLPAGVPNNLLRGPAFIFPLNQQQAALTTMKNPSIAGASTTGNSNSGSGSAPSSAPATISFNYPNLPANETQYLAILQNNPYQFPFPSHVGAPAVYRGTHPQAMPFFNGSFYSPQMLHPSQLQQPQHFTHGHQIPSGQNTGISSGSSSSLKHLQNHPQKFQGNGGSPGTVNIKQSIASPKNCSSQHLLLQQNQQLTEGASGDSPSTADSRGSRSNLGMFDESFAFPNHAQNFALMSGPSVGGGGNDTANGVNNGDHCKNGNHGEKKSHQQRQGVNVGVESLPSYHGFAVSFAPLNGGGATHALDIASMGPNHAILQNFPDAARHSYQVFTAAAQQAHHKKILIGEEVKKGSGGDALNIEEERKSMVSEGGLSNGELSIAFSKSDLAVPSTPVNNVVDSSSGNLEFRSGPGKTSGPLLSSSMNSANSFNSQQQQLQHLQAQQQQQRPQLIQLHKQSQHYMAPAARSKAPSMSNGSVYPDHMPGNGIMAANLTNSLSAFQQNHAPISGGNSSPTQSPRWKNSARTSISQVSSPALASSNSASMKNHYQQQSHIQISFGGGNPKSSTSAQGQQLPTGHQGPSQIMVGSPAGSSNYKSGGSSRTTAASMGANKAPQLSALSPSASLQLKNSSMPSRSSSPVGVRNIPSALGNSNMATPQGNSSSKPQMLQQHQQQMKPQLSKQAMQQALHPSHSQTSQGPNSTSSTTSLTTANSAYLQRRRPEMQSQQQSQTPSGSSSTGMLSMHSSTSAITSDPAKAIAAAAAIAATAGNNIKAAPSQEMSNAAAAQHIPSSFPYMRVVPAVGQAKSAQQKQQTGE